MWRPVRTQHSYYVHVVLLKDQFSVEQRLVFIETERLAKNQILGNHLATAPLA